MLDCLGEAIRQMLELMRRELDDVRPDHEQLRSELADVTTIFRDIRRRAGLAAERVADHLGSVIPVVLIARKASLAEFFSKAKVDIVRADARLAISAWRIRSQEMPERSGKTGTTRSSTRRLFGQERLISATLGCVQQSNLDRRS